ncbi:MAG: ABC transporter substrate-binding protein [Chloroflexota bacterium]
MTLKILGPNDPALAALEESLAAHPEVDAKVEIIAWENYRATLDECLAAPHATHQAVCVPGHIWLPQLAADGLVAPLDPMFEKLPLKITAAYNADGIFESVVAECKFQDRRYILPLFTDGHIVFYRSDLMSLPETVRPSEWHSHLQGQTLPKGMSPLALKAHASEILLDWLPYLWDFGGAVADEHGKPAFHSEAGIKALEYYTALKRFAPADTQEYGNGEILSALNEGKAAAAVSWGGQAAAIFDPTKNPHAAQMKTAALQGAWNATWGVCLPANQPEAESTAALNALLQVMGADCDQRVTRVAGSPVRKASYAAEEKSKYAWLASQERLLKDCRALPTDPAFSARLGGMYAAVHNAFTGKQPAAEALSEAAK